MTSTGRPPGLRLIWSRPSSNELRMSLPIAAAGPGNVEGKPILMVFCCAIAGPAHSASAAAPAINGLIMGVSLLLVPPDARAPPSGIGPTGSFRKRRLFAQQQPWLPWCLRPAKYGRSLGQLREQIGENVGAIADGREQVVARLVDHRFDARPVEPDHAGAIFAHPAADDDGVDIAALGGLHHGADGIVRGIEVDVV